MKIDDRDNHDSCQITPVQKFMSSVGCLEDGGSLDNETRIGVSENRFSGSGKGCKSMSIDSFMETEDDGNQD